MEYQGRIGYHNLNDWFNTTFSLEEQNMMIKKYQPMGAPPNSLTEGIPGMTTETIEQFLLGLSTWFRTPVGNTIWLRITKKLKEFTYSELFEYDVTPYPAWYYAEDIKQLKRENRWEEARDLAMSCVRWLEINHDPEMQLPPFYYEQLGIIFRKLKQPELGEKYTRLFEDVMIQNYFIQRKRIEADPDAKKYYPKGPVITKKLERILNKRNINI